MEMSAILRRPREGNLQDNIFYHFHGTGCFFKIQSPPIEIDVDFGPGDRCDGFDLFRIRDFYERVSDKYPELKTEGNIEYGFSLLVDKQIIYNPNDPQSAFVLFKLR
jgi:hypothetical protein